MHGRKKIAIIGMGYVGTAMYNMFYGRDDILVTAYDNNKDKGYKKSEVQGADLAIICVSTPSLEDGSCDTSNVEEVASWIDAPLVLIKSTVPPGTTDKLNVKYGNVFHFSPEYMGEGLNYVPSEYPQPRDPASHDFVIVGGPRADDVLEFFMLVMATTARYAGTDATTAEFAKYMENTFFATKVAFCNTFFDLAKVYGISYKELRELWLLDSRIGRSHTAVFENNRGFSGKCLPKDLEAIINVFDQHGLYPHLLNAVYSYNDELQEHKLKNKPNHKFVK